ncbi:MAG TPA: hypothetical protein PLL20_14725 [Phycisphaerae bacterium]|nr:hypothetical protein [Phycisphaerae bacterium]HRR85798.1 hypothetical protein [Phycisphaerae bacterium]
MTRLTLILTSAFAVLVGPALGQDDEITPDEATQLETLNQQPSVSQAPGEDVMRPTKHGVRLTPGLARAFAGVWIRETLERDIGATLSDEQKRTLSETIARKMMRMGHTHGGKVAPLLEFAVENMGPGQRNIKPDKAREFAEKAKETIPVWRELFSSMTDDCRPYLNEEQLKEIEKKQREIERALDKFDERMDRWARGEVKEGEGLFDDLENALEDESVDGRESRGKPRKSPEVRSAEQRAVWSTRDLDPANWIEFLNQVRQTFKLTDEQYARGRELLKDYTARAKALATPEWREKVRRNRALHGLGVTMYKESPAPWLFHLDQEYNEMAKPVLELRKAFQLEVMGLVTWEQREAVLAELREFGEKHGMTMDEADIRFPTTQTQ